MRLGDSADVLSPWGLWWEPTVRKLSLASNAALGNPQRPSFPLSLTRRYNVLVNARFKLLKFLVLSASVILGIGFSTLIISIFSSPPSPRSRFSTSASFTRASIWCSNSLSGAPTGNSSFQPSFFEYASYTPISRAGVFRCLILRFQSKSPWVLLW